MKMVDHTQIASKLLQMIHRGAPCHPIEGIYDFNGWWHGVSRFEELFVKGFTLLQQHVEEIASIIQVLLYIDVLLVHNTCDIVVLR